MITADVDLQTLTRSTLTEAFRLGACSAVLWLWELPEQECSRKGHGMLVGCEHMIHAPYAPGSGIFSSAAADPQHEPYQILL